MLPGDITGFNLADLSDEELSKTHTAKVVEVQNLDWQIARLAGRARSELGYINREFERRGLKPNDA